MLEARTEKPLRRLDVTVPAGHEQPADGFRE
jgi:hypothetical protein